MSWRFIISLAHVIGFLPLPSCHSWRRWQLMFAPFLCFKPSMCAEVCSWRSCAPKLWYQSHEERWCCDHQLSNSFVCSTDPKSIANGSRMRLSSSTGTEKGKRWHRVCANVTLTFHKPTVIAHLTAEHTLVAASFEAVYTWISNCNRVSIKITMHGIFTSVQE